MGKIPRKEQKKAKKVVKMCKSIMSLSIRGIKKNFLIEIIFTQKSVNYASNVNDTS